MSLQSLLLLLLAMSPLMSADTPSHPCKKMAWFTALGGTKFNPTYCRMLRAATMSAMLRAPSLQPFLIYSPSANFSMEETHFVTWYRKAGGVVVEHNLSFFEYLPHGVARDVFGTYLRLDIGAIMSRSLKADPSVWTSLETQYTLYTDADVIFEGDINSCSFPAPTAMAMGPQFEIGIMANAGITVMNVTAMNDMLPELVEIGQNYTHFRGSHDQTIVMEWCRRHAGGCTYLNETFNWKPYWGSPPLLVPAKIVHFHGLKPEFCLDYEIYALVTKMERPLDGWCGHLHTIWKQGMLADNGSFYLSSVVKYNLYVQWSYRHDEVLHHFRTVIFNTTAGVHIPHVAPTA